VFVLAVAVAAGLGLPSDLFSRTPPETHRLVAAGDAVRVVDGDTLRLPQTTVRLLGLDAPERGQQCRRGDGQAVDCGAAATQALAALVADRTVECRVRGQDRWGRSLAVCDADEAELNRTMVQQGWALARTELPALAVAEAEARAARRGLWAMGFDRPESWRRAQQ
jgi:endonuclease YncB( thermonuclease family)